MTTDPQLDYMQHLDRQLNAGQIGRAEYDLQKARLLATATRSPAAKVWGTIGIVLAVIVAMIVLGDIYDALQGY